MNESIPDTSGFQAIPQRRKVRWRENNKMLMRLFCLDVLHVRWTEAWRRPCTYSIRPISILANWHTEFKYSYFLPISNHYNRI